MADKIEWIKLILTNWKTIMLIITTLTGWIIQSEVALAEKEKVIEDTQQQVANVARHYVKTVVIEKKDQKGEGCTRICTRLSEEAMRLHTKEFH